MTDNTDIQAQIAAGSADIKAQIEADRRSRVWEKQAAAYVDAITGIQWTQDRRHRELKTLDGEPLLAEESPVDWTELNARLFAFASVDVLLALRAGSDAGLRARRQYQAWAGLARDVARNDELRRQDKTVAEGPTPQALFDAGEAARQAVQAANDKDNALVDAIRLDLHGEEGLAGNMLQQTSRQTR